MTDTTPRLALPYILPSQAQKHVTHNEALAILDAATQLVITDSLAAPPATPANGQCFWLLANATDAWTNHDGMIAVWQDGAWLFMTPQIGWMAFFRSSSTLLTYNGSGWRELPLPSAPQFSRLGVNASADDTNRFTIASDAVLFNHNGGDQRVKLNKAASGNTASLLYQSNWQGKAEIGLAGSDELSIKVCDVAGRWTTALAISPEGYVKQPAKPAATARFAPSEINVSEGQITGFDLLTMGQGGIVLQTTLGATTGQSLKIPTTGIYLVSLIISASAAKDYAATIIDQTQARFFKLAIGTVTGVVQSSQTTCLLLNQNTELSILHSGTATLGASSTGVKIAVVLL
ncbi:DUF2793 domain-containing protein [Rhizobium oryziradicis]|uniref:DUF2793 domain-containing protein n=1 Tax=Rhizobium oryziradicis TaxID=1867956 RepID=A0A1Q8ZQ91_9HYPH|nr:DUF2793 domain-containing protein [Rhizobium oryziradicis]OLP44209.1 hypothetical protein BJF95_06520 [Rhizobium oryziradicis]